MVIPFGNLQMMGKGFSLLWCKPTANFCLFNCCFILSRMIDVCVIADRKVFLLLHRSNHYLCLPQKKLRIQLDVNLLFSFTSALVCCDLIVSDDFINLWQIISAWTKPVPPISLVLSSSLNTPFMSLVKDDVKSSMMHLMISVLASRVVYGGIPVMSMVSVVASDGHTMRTYGADGKFLVPKTVHLTAHFGECFFSKTFMIDKRRNNFVH